MAGPLTSSVLAMQNPATHTLMVLVKDQYFVYKQRYSTIATLVEE